ncbi:hypothetical protein LY78DRAFT_643576 [Colletotrichum sublineola]|uniref:Uncharacterized protein n=1 Tax=Colletotrichum sublineola TaxID=1173701 RepID=A0A066XFD4_COLSU|nr:hypothetical protein LY78DRAFT_643576 [Colletotrichum sublineola]KDN64690.1 hypothetical protein CSUB01_01904 [Colletotrichum sublineola]
MSQPASSRKRSASAMSMSDSQDTRYGSQLPSSSINPLSHTPSVLRQLRFAGLTETDQPPSLTQPTFPHRAWQDPDAPSRRGFNAAAKALASSDEEEFNGQEGGENSDDYDGRRRRKRDGEIKAKYASEKSPLRPLVRAIYGFLDKGDATNAKRAFGILVRSHVHGKPVDIRRNNYWALGAEILMREGGGPFTSAANDGPGGGEETYPASNVPRVREYFQDLIQRYPYNFKYGAAVSAVDFWPALLSYEVFQVHTQHRSYLLRLEHEAEDWEDDSWQEPSLLSGRGGGGNSMTMDDAEFRTPVWQSDARDQRLRQARDQIRLRTLDALREIAGRMDDLLEDRPFSHSHELLRLRGMVSLYIGDLLIPAYKDAEGQIAEARIRRDVERNNARSSFQKMMEHGGHSDVFIQDILAFPEHDEGPILPVFSSLPIREYRMAI